MEFLDEIILDNTILNYLIVAGIILFIVLFKRFLSRYLGAAIYELVRRHWPVIQRKEFVELILQPLSFFLLTIVTVLALHSLHFPTILDTEVYVTTTKSIAHKLAVTLIIIAIINFLVSIINFVALLLKDDSVAKNERAQHQLIIFFKDFFKTLLYIIGLILILKVVFNVQIGTLVGGLGIAGAALALAARESIENIIASFIIFLDKPFFTGDQVKVNAYSGRVERIGLRSTRIRTQDKTLITVPNKQMVDSIVDNLSFRNFRRAEIKLELPPSYTAAKVRSFTEAANQLLQKNTHHFTSSSATVTEYNKSGITVMIEFFTIPIPSEEFIKIKEELMLCLMQVVEDQQAELSKTPAESTVLQPNAGVPPKSNPII